MATYDRTVTVTHRQLVDDLVGSCRLAGSALGTSCRRCARLFQLARARLGAAHCRLQDMTTSMSLGISVRMYMILQQQ